MIKQLLFLFSENGWKINRIECLTNPSCNDKWYETGLELVSKELNHLAAILHVYAGGLNFMK